MLPLKKSDRVRLLSAVAHRGAQFKIVRTLVITASLLILLAVPLLGIVRVDLWGGRHLVLGEEVGMVDALKGFIIAMAFLYGATFISNMLVGRFFCGWGCPVGFVSRFGEDVARKKSRWSRAGSHVAGAGFVATFVAAVILWWVDPRVIIDGSWTARVVTLGVFLVMAIGGFLHAFVWRFGFCLNVCPIGLYYRYVTSHAPVGIVFNEIPNPCIECGSCEAICPVALDPKHLGREVAAPSDADAEPVRYGDAECIRCGDCIEACRMIFSKRPGEVPPLRFGLTEPVEAGERAPGNARDQATEKAG